MTSPPEEVAAAPAAEPAAARVILTRSGVAHLAAGHPWIHARHVERAETPDGVAVRLQGPAGRSRGAAVWSSNSRLPLRVVSREPDFDAQGDWWKVRLDRAVARRATELAPGEDACRWVHAEADGLPGLIVDRYAEVAVLQAGCLWADRLAEAVARQLVETHGLVGVLARHDGAFRRPEGLVEEVRVLAGSVPETVRWRHAGVLRVVDPWHGQKTGAYLDQRSNQPWAARMLPAGRCLDAFCFDGGFALHLAKAGAEVSAVDSSAAALASVQRHAEANGLAGRIAVQRANVFEHLRAAVARGEHFEGIVVDPPALARRRVEVPAALRAYKELNLRALRLLRPGGRLVSCSCSSHLDRQAFLGVLAAAAADARREVTVLELRGAASCHPHLVTFPESAYLKVALLEVVG